MKRHEALAPLSREHHSALILAQLLKKDAPTYKGLPTALNEKVAYALQMFTATLQLHFTNEEGMLDKVRSVHAEIDKISEEIFTEHQQLKKMFLSLDKTNNTIEELDTLGQALDDHIRKEERVLFPLIQQHCSEAILSNFDFTPQN
ncbi:hemerythrin domain-containing protein [Ferruginibacter sp.]|jgi:iron-sulfur cluster repair protein YtfE (RIC family)|nr:hemerythrin domain-containing protein [Ferruginibacter sp.]